MTNSQQNLNNKADHQFGDGNDMTHAQKIEFVKSQELMVNETKQTAMQEHIAWLKKQLQQCIDEGYSESWISAYKLAIKHAESMLDKEKAQSQHWFKFGMLLVDGHLWKPLDKFEQYYNENHEQNNQSNQEHI